ncbi:hypothetical protein [Beijerinckia sp. L45]|uniref:hypothetical protein n=1 Tax=Beijerinckia sp. L45 TaxID=1641855 RepID=UPI0034CF5770
MTDADVAVGSDTFFASETTFGAALSGCPSADCVVAADASSFMSIGGFFDLACDATVFTDVLNSDSSEVEAPEAIGLVFADMRRRTPGRPLWRRADWVFHHAGKRDAIRCSKVGPQIKTATAVAAGSNDQTGLKQLCCPS